MRAISDVMHGGPEAFDPQREFIREITVRLERALRAVGGEVAAMRGEVGGMRGEIGGLRGDLRDLGTGILAGQETLREESRAMQAEIRDLRDETRAQTRALLHMIDRLEGGEAPAT